MREAVTRLHRALDQHEKILIYGDYDVDGTMAVVVLLTTLRILGATVEAYVPHRLTDGYGMRMPVVEEAAANGFRVVISVDTGIREHAVLERAQELGVDCIVTDHHLPDGHLPPACAILNPRRTDCSYPEKSLAGVGVAFKLAQALLGDRMTARLLQSFLKVVAIGTIADVVPLLGENRVIAHFGLEGLRQPAQSGLAALIELSGLAGKEISAGDVGFRLAPRLNAAGRMENARDVIDLFTSPEPARTREIAERLERLNRERQRVEEEILRAIVVQMDQRAGLKEQFSIVLAGAGWHRGVIGIVAQRVVERYHRPTLVIGIEDGVGVGSGRSIKCFHLLDASHLGGRPLPAIWRARAGGGLRLTPQNRFRNSNGVSKSMARSVLTAADMEPVLRVDAALNLAEVDWPLYQEIIQLEPFGMGNPTPVFGACGVTAAGHTTYPPGKASKTKSRKRSAHAGRAWMGVGGANSVASSRPERGHGVHRRTKQLSGRGQPATCHQGSYGNRRNGEFVATRGLGSGAGSPPKWLTGLVVAGISLTALAVGLAYWVSSTRHAPPAQTLPIPAPDVNQQLSGYTFTRFEQGRAVFNVQAARTLAYQQSKSTTLEDVTVEVFGRKGQVTAIFCGRTNASTTLSRATS